MGDEARGWWRRRKGNTSRGKTAPFLLCVNKAAAERGNIISGREKGLG
jgi:hypothetical protein